MKLRFSYLLILCLWQAAAYAQYPPQALVKGSTAISGTSGLFTGWATGCSVIRGYKDINDPSQGYVVLGDSSLATGKYDNQLVSLGDSGMAILTFSHPIYDGPGYDFAVFENGFADPANPEMAFLELAFVEVSSDGVHFFRFAPTCLTPASPQIPAAGVYMDARKINNLAGKYIGGYGTPFDLQELAGTPGLDVNSITHVRLLDVIGSTGSHASADKDGNRINDPYPTPIAAGGFDLDAVGALHQQGLFPSAIREAATHDIHIYPNPATDRIVLTNNGMETYMASVTTIAGNVLQQCTVGKKEVTLQLSAYSSGMYYLVLNDTKGNRWVEKIIKL